MGEDISEAYPGWRLFFDGAANHQGKGVGAVLVSKSGQHYPMAANCDSTAQTTWLSTKLAFSV